MKIALDNTGWLQYHATIVQKQEHNTETTNQKETEMENYDEAFEYVDDYVFDYTVNGIELDLIGEAYPTNRCLPFNPDGNLFEMQALAEGRNRNRYFVRWIFEDNGEEGYDDYDYSQPYDCVSID